MELRGTAQALLPTSSTPDPLDISLVWLFERDIIPFPFLASLPFPPSPSSHLQTVGLPDEYLIRKGAMPRRAPLISDDDDDADDDEEEEEEYADV